ncbi:hypothetical protein D6C84_02806 [Aureobasidium pullulans]|uniref:DUF1690-domain-containing protein n=1 Tax=Aureobasidium pullulans TaxID=5580 RepID=A0A4S9Y2S8_AURPU|nr:hypothetical protein JADG_005588 [Aureobasidium pullulans]THV77367.1 hypothetical protein D6D28_00383 [Aureobasidium pullulans]THW07052.1 hypothetical protein D6D26_01170 [Aureobasidium pullulans]THW18683.1 hypothetical protein D6D24_03248 [Aureobasidium pullulans]THW28553.1 hypothetical protein D6D23_01888 [Aureobasidium pullulans]
MGSGGSKPQGSQYVFAADSPVSFSPSVVDSLQNSSETDSTRSRNLELQIQQRVTAELERIRDEEAQRLAQYTERLTPSSEEQSDDSSSPSLKEKISSALTPSSSQNKDRSNDSVSKEVAELRSKLERRKKLDQTDASVEKAKDGLVQCLRLNDRRPLDCWEQVEAFKAEVAKLEQKFVDRTLR